MTDQTFLLIVQYLLLPVIGLSVFTAALMIGLNIAHKRDSPQEAKAREH